MGSNVSEDMFWKKDVEYLLSQPNTNIITWELNDLPLTNKFVELYKTRMHSAILWHEAKREEFYFNFIYDVYRNLTESSVLESRQEMNRIIEFLNASDDTWFTIPTDLKLNEVDLVDTRLKNLNELHDHFETRMEELEEMTMSGKVKPEVSSLLWDKLQSVNLLVHFNEKLGNNESLDYTKGIISEQESYFTSLKFDSPTHSDTFLEPADYKHFTMQRDYGPLMLDFGTVGKDLLTCSVTDDIELVHKNMVSQQIELNPWVSYDWTKCSEAEWQDAMKLYNDWIETNNVGNYLDLELKKYTPGRHQLGNCISHDFKTPGEFVDAIIKQTPKINSFFITDDQNKTIL